MCNNHSTSQHYTSNNNVVTISIYVSYKSTQTCSDIMYTIVISELRVYYYVDC